MRGKERHELACSNCGAPLHDLKHLRVHAPQPAAPAHRPKDKSDKRRKSKPATYGAYVAKQDKKPQKQKKKPYRKKKSTVRWFLEEAFDAIEDIFD